MAASPEAAVVRKYQKKAPKVLKSLMTELVLHGRARPMEKD